MEVIAWILLYCSIGVGLTTLWQLKLASGINKNDDALIVISVFLWPVIMPIVAAYHAVTFLTDYFEG